MVDLVHETQAAVAHGTLFGFGQAHRQFSVDGHRTAGRHVQQAQDMQQGALARAGCADDGDHLATRDRQADVAEHFDARRAFVVDLDDVLGLQGRRQRRTIRSINHGAAPVRGAGATRASWDTASPGATAPGRSCRS
ncbi:hypothetical protein G6F65_021750 [Rhizopus arrhizus]|nr:hypothetical protein G6F65_021750 [Rhizopus arrhizus]